MTEKMDFKGSTATVPTAVPPSTGFLSRPSSTLDFRAPPQQESDNLLKQATMQRSAEAAATQSPNKTNGESLSRIITEPPNNGRPGVPARAGTMPTLLRSMTGSVRPSATRALPVTLHDDSSDSEEEEATRRERTRVITHQITEALSGHKEHERTRGWPWKNRAEEPYHKLSLADRAAIHKGMPNKKDGRLTFSVNTASNSGYLAKALNTGIKHHLLPDPIEEMAEEDKVAEDYRLLSEQIVENDRERPRLNIVIIVIGSRGDIQPFLKIGKILKNDYGHRVRIATHPAFKEFVENDIGLEFFSVGGNPSELMAFMVKNPGLIPSIDTVKSGEIGRRRASMYEMFQGMWRACVNSSDDENDKENLKMMGARSPFIADAIIANPPSFAHVHIAERLGIPLHMMFTFPYTPTSQFPHPLANIKQTDVDRAYTNFMSYPLVDLMTWQGLGDLVNKFRRKTLGLEPVSTLWAPGQLYRFRVPYDYLWSPALVPKPVDWGKEINIAGFVFLDLASSFKPPEDLIKFLKAGEPPVYIGFGSIVVDDPNKFTQMIFDAVKMAGVRALVSKGWGGLGGNEIEIPDNIYMLDNTPHDWLFPQVCAVIHHGGAGTTAIGLKCGRPTMIVPFFGDQPFWGAMVAEARAGAFECIPYKKLTTERLANGIKECLTEEARANVAKIAESIANEGDGAANAVKSFHRNLHLRGPQSMRCFFLPNRVAVWQLKGTHIKLSALAAEILVEKGKVRWSQLRLVRHESWNDFNGPGEPITGGSSALYHSIAEAGKGLGGLPHRATKVVKQRQKHEDRKKRRADRKRKQNEAINSEAYAKDSAVGATEGHTMAPNNMSDEDGRKDSKITDPTATDSAALQPKNPRPAGPTHQDTQLTQTSTISIEPDGTVSEAIVNEARSSFAHTTGALVKMPLDLSLAVAQGFHNAPRLYGDPTVRQPRRIDGFQSGLRAGRDEFFYGLYDGVTGVVKLPYRGAREDGVTGAVAGVGMGLGGLVLKSISAVVGPGAYVSKGIEKEICKKHSPIHFVKRARMIQGAKEMSALRVQEMEEEQAKTNGNGKAAPLNGTATKNSTNKKPTKPTTGAESTTRVFSNPYKPHPGDPTLAETIAKVLQDYSTLSAGTAFADALRKQGPLGRMVVRKERRRMHEHSSFENAGTLGHSLQVRWEGGDVPTAMDKLREDEVEKVKREREKKNNRADVEREVGMTDRPVLRAVHTAAA